MLKVRLQPKGRKKNIIYSIVVIDSRFPIQGKPVENIGLYTPRSKQQTIDKTFNINLERYNYWISKGAQPSDTVYNFVKKVNKIQK